MSNTKITITKKTIGDMRIASIRYRGRYEECGTYFQKLYQQVQEQICGPAFCLYTDQVSKKGIEIECCFPVTQAVETGLVKSRVLPGGEMLSATHQGPYRTLGAAWSTLFDHIEGHNIRVHGPRREIYLDEEPMDSDRHITELQVPLEKSTRRAAAKVNP